MAPASVLLDIVAQGTGSENLHTSAEDDPGR
jgi:hypothetical protein